MPKITFVAHDGSRREVQASSGESLMLAAVNNLVPGIDADCGNRPAMPRGSSPQAQNHFLPESGQVPDELPTHSHRPVFKTVDLFKL